MATTVPDAAGRTGVSNLPASMILATVKENVSLTALDAATGAVVAAVEVGVRGTEKPHEIAVTRDGKKAFVSLYGSSDYGRNTPTNKLGVVDLTTMTSLGHVDLNLWLGPHAMMTDRDGKIWVTVDHSQCVLVIEPETQEIERSIWLRVPGHFLAAAPDGETVYFAAKEYPVIVEVDVRDKAVTAEIPVPVGAQAIRVSDDGKRLYVGDFHRPLLHVVDTGTRQVIETAALRGVPGWPWVFGDYVVVTTYDEPADRGFVEILYAKNLRTRRVVEVAAEPFHALPARDSSDIYVALGNGDIPRISLERAEVVGGGFKAGGSMVEALVWLDR